MDHVRRMGLKGQVNPAGLEETPAGTILEGSAGRLEGNLGMVVLLAQVGQKDVGRRTVVIVADELGGSPIREMTHPAQHALLELPGIRAHLQQILVVIRLQNQPVAAPQPGLDLGSHFAQIRHHHTRLSFGLDSKTDRLRGVVRYGKGFHTEITHLDRAAAVEFSPVLHLLQPRSLAASAPVHVHGHRLRGLP